MQDESTVLTSPKCCPIAAMMTSYLLEGKVVLKVAGQPDQKLKAGDSFHIPPGTPHDACPTPGQGVKGLGTFVVEKGKPLATPAPAP